MLWLEIKKKFFNIFFLVIFVICAVWMYISIKPTVNSMSYGLVNYVYYKPLEKNEFIYYNLKRDYSRGFTTAYTDVSDQEFWPEYEVRLTDKDKKWFLQIIKKMNPNYSDSESMCDVELKMSFEELKPIMQKFEREKNIKSFYYSGMYLAPEKFDEKMMMINSPSPYWIYLECGKNIFSYSEFESKVNGYVNTYKNGISKGFARTGIDYVGVIMGILALVFSFYDYAEDRKFEINEFIYQVPQSSVTRILYKKLATTIPLFFVSIIYSILSYVQYEYYNYLYKYGYNLQVSDFIKGDLLNVIPTVLIITMLCQLIGNLFENEFVTIILVFGMYFLSIMSAPATPYSLNLVVRYSDFDDYEFYSRYIDNIIKNRISIMVLTMLLLAVNLMIYSLKRNVRYRKIFKIKLWNSIKLFFLNYWHRWGYKKIRLSNVGLLRVLLYQTIPKNILIYILGILMILPRIVTPNMTPLDIATIGENILIFASLFLFVRLGNYDNKYKIEELMRTTKVSYTWIYFIRVIIACSLLFFMIELPVVWLCACYKIFVGRWCAGIYVSSLFVGMISLLVAGVLQSDMMGYFVYIIYYLLDTVIKNGLPFTLSGYTKHVSFTKYYLLFGIIILIILIYVSVKRKGKLFYGGYT